MPEKKPLPPLDHALLARTAEMLALPERICRRRECRRRHRCSWFFRDIGQPCCLANLDADQRRLFDELAETVRDARNVGRWDSKVKMTSRYRETRALEDAAVEAARPLIVGGKAKRFYRAFEAMRTAQPAPVQYGSGGLASVGQIVGELYARQTGARLEHIPYKGSGAMRNDLLGGQIRMAVDALPQNLPFLRSGQLRLLAVTTRQPVPQAPDIPAVGQLGYPGLIAENFIGISGPAGLPEAVSQRLNDAIALVLNVPAIRAKLEGQGFVLARKSPAEFTDFVRRQAEDWGPVVRATGASL